MRFDCMEKSLNGVSWSWNGIFGSRHDESTMDRRL
jgi:hypothetical protein